MSRETVVGWDGSAPARRALEWALTRAEAHDDAVLIARVVAGSGPGRPADEATIETAEVALADAHRSAQSLHPRLTVTSRLLVGDTVEELRSLADERTLLVVGSPGREPTGLGPWTVGASLAATSYGPVAIVPDDAAAVSSLRSGTVAGVDGSAASRAAAAFAAAEAVRRGETFTAVHAWQLPPAWGDGHINEETAGALESVHHGILDMTVDHVHHEFPTLAIQKIFVMESAMVALKDASVHSRMLVLGNHGLAVAPRLALGPVSHSLVCTAEVPTIVVRAAISAL
jgi:nucleotide-binding universal stress UspA family protein